MINDNVTHRINSKKYERVGVLRRKIQRIYRDYPYFWQVFKRLRLKKQTLNLYKKEEL